ncbi:hypothetical protein PC128_g1013 [Phytophthora cactorum]|nr:hypothetical protein PC120_g3345 [Phytophthora cactorum]KAG3052172.1 hypothetical protein PC121_g17428 [Phytophthora cactorum]KAG3205992.1 hypothetical protein PC128_g1013 [Phytophthora cactorum]KAG4047499.1 hypothetical protein PC123_g17150 [Phytophthora cactorum]
MVCMQPFLWSTWQIKYQPVDYGAGLAPRADHDGLYQTMDIDAGVKPKAVNDKEQEIGASKIVMQSKH